MIQSATDTASFVVKNGGAIVTATATLAGVMLSSLVAWLTLRMQTRRDQQKTDREWARQDILTRNASRAAAYEELLAAAQAMSSYASWLRTDIESHAEAHGPTVPNLSDPKVSELLISAMVRVRLVGSTEVREAAERLMHASFSEVIEAHGLKAHRGPGVDQPFPVAYAEVLELVRADLGYDSSPSL